MKLTIEHIQHYPVGGKNALKLIHNSAIHTLVGLNEDCLDVHIRDSKYPNSIYPIQIGIENCKPLLLPLSALYEEIDGEIGIVELAKIATSDLTYCNDLHWKVGGKKDKYATARKEEYDFAFDYDGVGAFWISQRDVYDGSCPEIEIHSQLALFDYLFSHHYDVYDLCSKGLALDKTKIK